MKRQRTGKVMTVSSVAGMAPSAGAGYAHFGAAKAPSPITRDTWRRILARLADPDNLMNFLFPHGMMVTEEQVAIILQSSLVQTGPTGQKFIQITPIAIVATSEPATLLLLGSSLGVLLIATAINRMRKLAS